MTRSKARGAVSKSSGWTRNFAMRSNAQSHPGESARRQKITPARGGGFVNLGRRSLPWPFGVRFEGIVSKRLGSRYRSGRSKDWLKFKNPDAPAVKREAEEEWG
jgi:hypothetical protein